jgi:phosphatidylethanolamine/phosphatidyl-N-methylethanolamine N-methyltransferase
VIKQKTRQMTRGTATSPRGVRDDLRFAKSMKDDPKRVGALKPSSQGLARMMAAQVDQGLDGKILELGPGTGSLTEGLLAAGVPEERLIMLEMGPEFCALLGDRYQAAKIVQGDAFDLKNFARNHLDAPLAAIVSGLPLFNFGAGKRRQLIHDCLDLLDPEGSFIQFTYRFKPPVTRNEQAFRMSSTRRIWWNLFPAKVWIYRPVPGTE